MVGVGIGAALIGSSGALADVEEATDDDPANQLWDCSARRVPMGDPGVDVLRCLTFTFDPPDDIESAVLYFDIDAPTNSLQDTDSLQVAVGQPFEECAWAQGAMAGCLIVHGGFAGGERSLVVDLLNLGCDASAPVVDDQRQQALVAQLATGVVHVMLQDDTAVNRAWLDINGDPPPQVCGTSTQAVPVAVVEGQTAASSDGGSNNTKTVTTVVGVAAAGAVIAAGGVQRRPGRPGSSGSVPALESAGSPTRGGSSSMTTTTVPSRSPCGRYETTSGAKSCPRRTRRFQLRT